MGDRHNRSTARKATTRKKPGIWEPEWGEVYHLRWKKGESLRFAVYDKGVILTKKQGMAAVPWRQFYPQEFESVLVLADTPDEPPTLHVKITPCRVDEYTIELNQKPGERLGI